MKKAFFLLIIALLTMNMSFAQSLSQVVIASSGATISGATSTLSFTAGEAVIGKISNNETLGQGFWLGAIEGLVLRNEDFTSEIQTTIYPNPVTDYLNISFQDMTGELFGLSVYDINGKQVYKKQLTENAANETIDFNGFSNGIYILNISQNATKKSKCFKIIKQ